MWISQSDEKILIITTANAKCFPISQKSWNLFRESSAGAVATTRDYLLLTTIPCCWLLP